MVSQSESRMKAAKIENGKNVAQLNLKKSEYASLPIFIMVYIVAQHTDKSVN